MKDDRISVTGTVALAIPGLEMPAYVVSCGDLEEVFDEGDFLDDTLVNPSNSAFLTARKVSMPLSVALAEASSYPGAGGHWPGRDCRRRRGQ